MKRLVNKPEDVVTEELRWIRAAHPDLLKVSSSCIDSWPEPPPRSR